jgi:SOS-response transcriptional repressor LexA
MNIKAEKLLQGETIISKEPGNSMLPILKSRQPVRLAPATCETVEVGDIVFCKVHGNFYTHKVYAKDVNKGCLIGNNKGHKNGWTKSVFGKVIEILPMHH